MSYLNHQQWLGKIHELSFLEANRRASQYFLSLLTDSYQNNAENPQILLDMRQSGLLPLVYLGKELERLQQNYPQAPQTYLAFVLDTPQTLNTCQYVLAPALKTTHTAYFTEIDAARFWLSRQH